MENKLSAKAYIRNYLSGFGLRQIIECADFLTDLQKVCLVRVYFDLENPAQVGESLGLSGERVRQIANRAQRHVWARIMKMKMVIEDYDNQVRRERLLNQRIKVLIQRLNEAEKPIPSLDEVSMTSIEDIDLSVRAYNSLKALRLDTVGDIVKTNPGDLLGKRNVGQKTIIEIREMLNEKGIDW